MRAILDKFTSLIAKFVSSGFWSSYLLPIFCIFILTLLLCLISRFAFSFIDGGRI